MSDDVRVHRCRQAKPAVQATEIAVGEVQRDGCLMFLQLLRRSIRQACKSANLHPVPKILPLDMQSTSYIAARSAESRGGFRSRCAGELVFAFARSQGLTLGQSQNGLKSPYWELPLGTKTRSACDKGRSTPRLSTQWLERLPVTEVRPSGAPAVSLILSV